ncbi:MAG TPA: sensor histidine kinase [Candidatus Acidoferrales bacterium]|nr:sensor histidine kinase [Candidatus Acidoferrales bacterium]
MDVRVSTSAFDRASVRWATALVSAALALVLARGLHPFLGELAPFITAFPAVAIAAWRCGLWQSFASIAITVLGGTYWFIEPLHSFRIPGASETITLLAWILACVMIVAVGEMNRRENEKLRKEQGELEEKVRQRTTQLDQANDSLSDLTARLLQLQDEERRRIARDLHDSIGQTTAVLGVNLSRIESEMERVVKAISIVKDSQQIVRETGDNVRTISYLLHPPLLDENGLASALPWYTEGFSGRSGIAVKLDLPEDIGRLSHDSEVAIFRVVQESLTNIHRHSGAACAHIRLSRSSAGLCVRIEDDGKGIPAARLHEMASAGTPGVGIRGMRERVRQLGGTLQIDSRGADKGTVVIVRLPFITGEAPVENPSPLDETATAPPRALAGADVNDVNDQPPAPPPNDDYQNFTAHAP